MRLTGLLVIQLDLFSTESYSETWNTLWYFSLIRSYMECKRLCNKVLERIENIFFLEIVLRISFRSGSNNNYTIKKFVILEETSGDQPLLKAWSGRAGWSGPCLITFWIWMFHSLFRPVFNCPLFFSSKILCLHAFPIWRCSRFGRTCAVPVPFPTVLEHMLVRKYLKACPQPGTDYPCFLCPVLAACRLEGERWATWTGTTM